MSRDEHEYRVFPDYGADPVWAVDGMVDLDTLPISEDLITRLRAWNAAWEELVGARQWRYEIIDQTGHERWLAEGRGLATWLERELGPDARITYNP